MAGIKSLKKKLKKLYEKKQEGDISLEINKNHTDLLNTVLEYAQTKNAKNISSNPNTIFDFALFYYLLFYFTQPNILSIKKKKKKTIFLSHEFHKNSIKNIITVNKYLWNNYSFTFSFNESDKLGSFDMSFFTKPIFDNSVVPKDEMDVSNLDYKNIKGYFLGRVFLAISDYFWEETSGYSGDAPLSVRDNAESKQLGFREHKYALQALLKQYFESSVSDFTLSSLIQQFRNSDEPVWIYVRDFAKRYSKLIHGITCASILMDNKENKKNYAIDFASSSIVINAIKLCENQIAKLLKNKKESKFVSLISKIGTVCHQLDNLGEKHESISEDMLYSEENQKELSRLYSQLLNQFNKANTQKNNSEIKARNQRLIEDLFVEAEQYGLDKNWVEKLDTFKKVNLLKEFSVLNLKEEFGTKINIIKDIRSDSNDRYLLIKNIYKLKKTSVLKDELKSNDRAAKEILIKIQEEVNIKKLEKLLDELNLLQEHQRTMISLLKTGKTIYSTIEKKLKVRKSAVLLYKKKPTFFEILKKYSSNMKDIEKANHFVHYLYLLFIEYPTFFSNDELESLILKLKEGKYLFVANKISKKLKSLDKKDDNMEKLEQTMENLKIGSINIAKTYLKKLNHTLVVMGSSRDEGIENAWTLVNGRSIKITNEHKRATSLIRLTRVGVNSPYNESKSTGTTLRYLISDSDDRERLHQLLLLMFYYKKVYGEGV